MENEPQPVQEIRLLLESFSVTGEGRGALAGAVARAAMGPNHLYEDLGFSRRQEMNALMAKHYPGLAVKKPETVRWKKFLFDAIGKIAPACDGCLDYDNCFGCDLTQKNFHST